MAGKVLAFTVLFFGSQVPWISGTDAAVQAMSIFVVAGMESVSISSLVCVEIMLIIWVAGVKFVRMMIFLVFTKTKPTSFENSVTFLSVFFPLTGVPFLFTWLLAGREIMFHQAVRHASFPNRTQPWCARSVPPRRVT